METKSTFRRLLGYAYRYKLTYLILGITMIVGVSLDLVIAWYLNQITNAAVGANSSAWPFLIGAGAVILVFTVINGYVDIYFKTRVSSKIRNDIRLGTLEKLLCLPAEYYRKNHSGELLSRLTSDNQAIGQACSETLITLIRNPLLALLSFIYLLTLNWKLALICIFIGPVTMLIGGLFGKMLRRNSNELQNAIAEMTSRIQEIIGSSFVFKSFGLEGKLLQIFRGKSNEVSRVEIHGGKIVASVTGAATGIGILAFIVTFITGGYFVARGDMAVGGLIAFIQLMNHLTWPFTGLASLWGDLQQAIGAADRIFKVLDEKAEYHSIPESLESKPGFQSMELRQITFGYDRDRPVLHEISLTVEAGRTIAIVGPSGGGKSTLFGLLLGLSRPQQGEIFMNGREVRDMELHELRNYFSVVPQENCLYSGTIRDNIADGKRGATEEEIIRAAADANAIEFIRQLPEGLETEVGEGGSNLSVGQRQRIAIARALLRNAPVLLLDEATSSLDNESERLVQEALSRLKSERTVIVIAHRLSTIRQADQIFVMDQGRVIDQGTHEELMASGGLYEKLHHGLAV
ncbi:subfamily B ATP-binding cassette protein MsbA [Fontibacillus phaseoli]|uniref:Subfamily B ATP-binding cassette protein MsbA n=1 Tax=Fontibacillus phaseoli TaxID=1416533 RepID=A0A369B547_9BACL|nr:ABC transporter ATP-binding protein [Fontibacillus phaseoli]RCX16445.1 subfamily B ATP-binding cassette protein MsbA [Fontibacillus phaseoli]